jgi:hypothetical protein
VTEPDPEEDWDVDEPPGQSSGIGSVNGDRNINVTDPRGSVVVMEQVAFYLRSAAGDGAADTAWSPRLVPEDILTDLARRFVLPPGYGDLMTRLRNPGTVVVSGPPGCGRRSAALMVLKDSGEGATRFRELPDDDLDGRFVLDAAVIEQGERLLLDLSAETRPISRRVLTDLRAYRAAVTDKQAFLAIVLPLEQQGVAAELGTAAMIIGRPEGAEVFRRHLALCGIEVTDHELRDSALLGHLTRDPMRHLAALAERVRRARGAAAGQGGWTAWLGAAIETDTHVDEVAGFVRDHPDGRMRALLLAAALFEHATPETVASAAAALLEITKYPPHEEHALDLPDLAEALGKVGATIDDRQVRFGSVAYANAVRTHFWRTFPQLRGVLRLWVAKAARPVSTAERSLAVLRYTDQCLRIGHPEDLCRLAERWARESPSTPDKMLDVAGAALTRGLLNERYGRSFRRHVYQWVINRQLWPSLATLLVGLSESVIAPAQPLQGLVRLRHLTRHQNAGVVAEARAALARLSRDGRFARRLLTRVHEDLVGDRPRDVDYALFLDVADPVRLTSGGSDGYPRVTEPAVRDMVVDGWAEWLARRPYAESATAVTRWLDAHAETGRDVLIEILAAATGGLSPRRAVLYVVSRDWVAAATPDRRPSRRKTAALLQQACAAPLEPVPTQGASH